MKDRRERIEEFLKCPVCGMNMIYTDTGKSLICKNAKAHCFDLASSGYVNLAPSHSGGGDSKEAVRSRSAFLNSEKYRPIADALIRIIMKYLPQGGHVLDAGCGEGYYSCGLASESFFVSGFDLSKAAVDSAAKRAGRAGLDNTFFAVSSVYSLPVSDASADAVVNIFAPCAETEYLRVLKDGGIIAFVYAGPCHLMGLKNAVYDEVYSNEERSDAPKDAELLEEQRIRFTIFLEGKDEISALFSMTPYYWRTSLEDKERLLSLDRLETEVDIIIAVYKKKG